MQLITVRLPRNHNIFHFGDEHDGSILYYEAGWNKLVKAMGEPYDGCSNNYGVDGGDLIEAITVKDKRFSPEKMKEPRPLNQMENAVERRKPIKDRLLAILDGNHPYGLWEFGDVTKKIAEDLNVPFGTYTAKIIVKDPMGNLMYKIFETHGGKNITSTADDPKRRRVNMQLILKRQMRHKAGDCVVMVKHHAHKLIVCKPDSELYLTDDGKEITQKYTGWGQTEEYIHPDARWYGCAGSFLRLYGDGISGYAERREYDPVELGFLVTKVRDGKVIGMEPYYL
uniref:Uncharacterized protein n=1 Tax=viral metagenome TaxID=1070528 RepID=A0A6M3LJX1_9ZZZZ